LHHTCFFHSLILFINQLSEYTNFLFFFLGKECLNLSSELRQNKQMEKINGQPIKTRVFGGNLVEIFIIVKKGKGEGKNMIPLS